MVTTTAPARTDRAADLVDVLGCLHPDIEVRPANIARLRREQQVRLDPNSSVPM